MKAALQKCLVFRRTLQFSLRSFQFTLQSHKCSKLQAVQKKNTRNIFNTNISHFFLVHANTRAIRESPRFTQCEMSLDRHFLSLFYKEICLLHIHLLLIFKWAQTLTSSDKKVLQLTLFKLKTLLCSPF